MVSDQTISTIAYMGGLGGAAAAAAVLSITNGDLGNAPPPSRREQYTTSRVYR